jgi:peptide-methionine (R)-S-oxide reductase
MKRLNYLLSTIIFAVTLTSCQAKKPMETSNKAPEEPTEKVVKTEAEWKKILTAEQFRVARKSGTESPNGDVYKQFKKQGAGAYHCAGCGAKLFSSKEKFDARCGWPAFYDPAKAENVSTKEDRSFGSIRTEVNCAKCDAHLGHLFKGEGFNTPKDQRFCINGIVLKFVPDKPAKEEAKKVEPENKEKK